MAPTLAERITKVEDRLDGPDGVEGRIIRLEATVEHHEEADQARHAQVVEKIDAILTHQKEQDARLWKVVVALLTAAGLGSSVGGLLAP